MCTIAKLKKKLPSLDNEVSTVTDMIEVLITAGNIHNFVVYVIWWNAAPGQFGADRSAWGRCLFWGDSLGSIYIPLGYFYINSNSNWRYITDPGTRKT